MSNDEEKNHNEKRIDLPIQKIGSSHGIIIQKKVLDNLYLREGDWVTIVLRKKTID